MKTINVLGHTVKVYRDYANVGKVKTLPTELAYCMAVLKEDYKAIELPVETLNFINRFKYVTCDDEGVYFANFGHDLHFLKDVNNTNRGMARMVLRGKNSAGKDFHIFINPENLTIKYGYNVCLNELPNEVKLCKFDEYDIISRVAIATGQKVVYLGDSVIVADGTEYQIRYNASGQLEFI